ncbi:Piso0_004910 [Millerozyma farinosa CBS 7064]|uniref:GPN-loop GTPase n=1 Tax=Pichia sorbitophila (strain ATCC MYA-4447 / BCRC 22081 / CBS 7064 / NBRC 10061 / NRRL Y-12695) TaxID=559304 RepID=G8Y3Q4_PICSO|nr:Piso0_004910 [Millerozyma farinosa CBS 7064]
MAPSTVICIGMAGSGKTTFMQRLNSHLHAKKTPPYVINLDPAVLKVPFGSNIDIRDSVKYKKVMEDYNLGPNGAIVTSLNLFSTKIDQVIKLIENKSDRLNNVIIDTPGQIECFIWSASGAIITEAFASTFPTVIAYIVDTPRNSSPTTFMSNMLYACSILYKTKLPMIVVFNKTDVKKADFAKEWMQDFEAFQMAMMEDKELNGEDGASSGYMSSLINSMSLMLEEFYSQLDVVGVSAYTGQGFDDFLAAVDNKVEEYNEFYKAEREKLIKEKQEKEKKQKNKSLSKLMSDLDLEKGKKKDSEVLSDYEESENEYEGEVERDEDDVERGYTFPEDRFKEVDSGTDADLQARYQEAFEKTAKTSSSKTAEDIAAQIRR